MAIDLKNKKLLKEWDKIKNEACERGTKIHAQLENSFKDCDLGWIKKCI